MGRICFHPLVLSGWRTEQPLLECFLLLVQVPSSEFLQDFSKEDRVSQWYSRVTQGVWSSHGVGVLTLFSLLLRMICGVYRYGECCVPWLPILPSRMVIHEGLELNQIPILWDVKEMEGDGLMLGKGIWSFIWTPCLQLFERVGFSSLIFNSFF